MSMTTSEDELTPRAKVLVVDDSRTARARTLAFLSNGGFQVSEATSGEDGLAVIAAESPDCVITDLLMPGMDGEALLGALVDLNSDVPVIVVTADIQDSVRDACMKLGARDFLHKPVEEGPLLEAVRRVLEPGGASADTVDLTDEEADVVTEVLNIGMGRAASLLGEMVGLRVSLQVPVVRAVPSSRVKAILQAAMGEGESVAISQSFTGNAAGKAVLVFPEESGLTIGQIVGQLDAVPDRLDIDLEGVLTEVGNIVLNGVLGSIANLMGTRLKYGVPYLTSTFVDLFGEGRIAEGAADVVLIAETQFGVQDRELVGVIVLAFEVESLESVLSTLGMTPEQA